MSAKTAKPRRLAIALLLAALAGGVLSYLLVADYEVLEKGQLLPYTAGKIYKVRFGGWLTLYLEPELQPSWDLLDAYLRTGAAFIALTFSAILATAGRETGSARFRFFVVAFLGMSYLVADEMLGIHETIGHNLQFLAALPLVKRPDDAVTVFLAVPAALVLLAFRSVLLASRKASVLWGVALLSFLASAVADVLDLPLEEAAEVFATVCLAAGMIVLGLHHTRLGPEEPRGARATPWADAR